MSEKLQFRISSALKNVIGRDLITDDFVAIFELVKNSFDASAKNVTIRYDFDEGGNSKIYIIDDGKGMSREDLIEKWLFVAFSAKKEGTEDYIKRAYAGNKGVGRFSCDRLGSLLKIQAKTESNKIVHCLDIDWTRFEGNSNKEFVEIDVDYSEYKSFVLPENLSMSSSGVVLEISCIRDEELWDRKKLIRLKRSLEKLIDPVSDVEESGLISLICDREIENDFLDERKAISKNRDSILVNGKIQNTIFKVLKNKTTVLKAKVITGNRLQVELIDRGVFIFKTEEDISKRFPKLEYSGFYAEISYLNKSAKYTFSRRMGLSVKKYGSVFLIRNGFRVYPVGDEGNDYWGLDTRKQEQYAAYVGTRDLLGLVKIHGDDKDFLESSSRNQGLIQTESAIQLSACFLECIKKLETYVVGVTWKDKLDKEYSEFSRMSLDSNRHLIIQLIEKLSNSKDIEIIDFNHDLVSILNERANEFEPSLNNLRTIATNINDEKLINQVSIAEKAFLKAKKAEYEALIAADKEKEARLEAEAKVQTTTAEAEIIAKKKDVIEVAYKEEKKRNLFLTGSSSRDKDLLEGFIHQIIIYASHSRVSLQNILQSSTRFEKMTGDALRELLVELLDTTDKIISTSRFATTANFRLDSSMLDADFNSFIAEYLGKIAPSYNARIIINVDVDNKDFPLRFNPIEMGMVLENFINNSKKARASNIFFTSSVKMNILEITIVDDGKGLDKQIEEKERIFEKGFTRTYGSGLGLYFCKNQIESVGGEIKLSEVQPKRGMSLTIRMVKK